MKTTLLAITAFVTLTFALSVSDAHAQQAQTRPSSPVCVVDVSYIFKNHERFKQSMESMKGQVKAFEDQLRAEAKRLTTLREELADFNPGSADYKKREQDIARRQAQLQADTQLKRKEFLEMEARVYHKIYTEITREIARFCTREGFSLVLRYNSEKINPDDRASVLQGVNRAVVYQRNLNITTAILDRLNGAGQPRVSQAPSSQPRRSGGTGTQSRRQ